MRDLLKNLGRSSVLYGLGSVMQRALMFLLLPLFTRYLPPDEYGVLALVHAGGTFLRPLVWLGLGQALIWAVVYHHENERDGVSSALWFLALQASLLLLVVSLFAAPLADLVLGDAAHATLLRTMMGIVLVEIVEVLFVTHARIHERAGLFTRVLAGRLVLMASLQVGFLAGLERGVRGLLEAHLLTSALSGGFCLFLMRGVVSFRVNLPLLRRMLGYGLPLAPASLAAMVVLCSDRYFLQHYRSAGEVGLYAVGYNLAMVVNLVVQAVQMGWLPQMYKLARLPDAATQLARLVTYYVVALLGGALALSLLSREVLLLMATPAYAGAERVVPLVALAYVLVGVDMMTNVGVSIRNRNGLITVVTGAAAALNLALNAWLIPRWGMMGAAWSTLLAYSAQTALQVAVNHRLWPVPYQRGRLLRAGVLAAALYGASLLLPEALGPAACVAAKLALLAAFAGGVWGWGVLGAAEKDALRRWITRRRA